MAVAFSLASCINVLAVNLAGFFVGNLGVTPHNLKYIWAVGGGAGVITSQVCGWLSDRVGPFKVMTGVNVLAACLYGTMFLYGGLGLPPLLLMAVFLICATGRIVMNNTIASLTAPPELRGRFMSLMSAVNQAACAVGVFVASRVLMSAASGRILNMDKLGLYAVATTILGPILVGALLLRRPTNAVPVT